MYSEARTGTPDLLLVDLLELLREVLTVCGAAVELETATGLRAVLHALVQALKDRQVGLLEHLCPVERTTTRGR